MGSEIHHAHDDGSAARTQLDSNLNSPCDESYRPFYLELCDLINRHLNRGLQLSIRHNVNQDIIQITGPGSTPKGRAADGLDEVLELAQATAEHHPYWALLHHSSEVAYSVLKEWDGSLSADAVEEIEWLVREMDSTIKNIKASEESG